MWHKRDAKGGQSESPMWVPNTCRVRGVVSYETPTTNGDLGIDKLWYDFLASTYQRTS
jgi:hypothetical protein